MVLNGRLEAPGPEVLKVIDGVLAAGQDEEIDLSGFLRAIKKSERDTGLPSQEIEVGVVREMRKRHDADPKLRVAGTLYGPTNSRKAVLRREWQVIEVRDDPEDRMTGLGLDKAQSRSKQLEVAAESVDDETFHQSTFLVVEQRHRPDDGGKEPATVDVAHQEHGRIRHRRHTHVGEIPVLQVHFNRAASPLDDYKVVRSGKATECLFNDTEGAVLERLVPLGRHQAQWPPHDNDLAAGPGVRLQENRVHLHPRPDARSFGLHRL